MCLERGAMRIHVHLGATLHRGPQSDEQHGTQGQHDVMQWMKLQLELTCQRVEEDNMG